MSILQKIVEDKKREVALKKSLVSFKQLSSYNLFDKEIISLSGSIENSNSGIIAEHKRRSPSKSTINHTLSVAEVAKGYENAGVSGISILTDQKYFGGSLEDLVLARASVSLPILRKEFIIDEYQIVEAKAHGADAILLIASILTTSEIKSLSQFAQAIELEVLLEVHNLEELQRSLMPSLNIIGVNNRNLATFDVDLSTSIMMSEYIPQEFLKISESGITSPQNILELQKYGYQGFLIGENFMKTDNPGKSAEDFIQEITMSKIYI